MKAPALLIACWGAMASGCGSTSDAEADADADCLDFCAELNDCGGDVQYECDALCADIGDVNEAEHCDTTWESMLGCYKDNPDTVCSTFPVTSSTLGACGALSQDWSGCYFSYCSDHPDASLCGEQLII